MSRLLLPALRSARRRPVAWRLASTTSTTERDDAAKRSFASRLKDVGVGFAANASRSKEEKQINLGKAMTGGLPDFVEEWTPDLFRKVGKGLGVAAVASWPLAFHHDISLLVPLLASGATVGYWKIGLDDLKQTSSAPEADVVGAAEELPRLDSPALHPRVDPARDPAVLY